MMLKRSLYGAILAGLAMVSSPALSQDLDKLVKDGKASYDQLCSKCHGKDLVNSGASSFDLREFPLDQKDRFYNSVENGFEAMPAWGDILLPGELDALWAYVATKGGTQPMPEDDASLDAPEAVPTLVAEGKLTACLARNGGALSGKRSDGGVGLDYLVLADIAEALELDLDVVWFESEQEEESDPVRESYAQLAYPLCDITASHPLYENTFGPPHTPTAALPRWLHMPTTFNLRSHVTLKPVAVTRPYMRSEIGMVVRPKIQDFSMEGLEDLHGLKLGLQQGTLSGMVAWVQAPRDVIKTARMFNPGPKYLWEIEQGKHDVDVAIVDVTAFDHHLRQNPISDLRLAEWRHALGMNIGFAILEENAALIAQVNAAVDDLVASGAVAQRATESRMHYAKPKEPLILGALTQDSIRDIR
ncbi:MAG: c-type cytochrome [Paracoccaceae bacterium]